VKELVIGLAEMPTLDIDHQSLMNPSILHTSRVIQLNALQNTYNSLKIRLEKEKRRAITMDI